MSINAKKSIDLLSTSSKGDNPFPTLVPEKKRSRFFYQSQSNTGNPQASAAENENGDMVIDLSHEHDEPKEQVQQAPVKQSRFIKSASLIE